MKVTLTEKINWTKYNLTYPGLGDIIEMIRTGNMQLLDNEFNGYTLKQATASRSLAFHFCMSPGATLLICSIACFNV